MDASARCSAFAHRQCHIDLLTLKARCNGLLAQLCLAFGQCINNAVLQAVDGRALCLTLFWRHAAQRLQLFRNRALLAKSGDTHGFNGRLVSRRRDVFENLPFELF